MVSKRVALTRILGPTCVAISAVPSSGSDGAMTNSLSPYSTRSCASASSRSSRCMYRCVVEMFV